MLFIKLQRILFHLSSRPVSFINSDICMVGSIPKCPVTSCHFLLPFYDNRLLLFTVRTVPARSCLSLQYLQHVPEVLEELWLVLLRCQEQGWAFMERLTDKMNFSTSSSGLDLVLYQLPQGQAVLLPGLKRHRLFPCLEPLWG